MTLNRAPSIEYIKLYYILQRIINKSVGIMEINFFKGAPLVPVSFFCVSFFLAGIFPGPLRERCTNCYLTPTEVNLISVVHPLNLTILNVAIYSRANFPIIEWL